MFARLSQLAACTVLMALFAVSAVQAAPLPEIRFTDLSGKPQSLDAYKGKVIVLNFWASWCGPCREELPMLEKLMKEYEGKDVVILAASIDDAKTQPNIARFLEKKKIEKLSILTGATAATLKQFDLGLMVPATIVIDGNGEVVGRILGEAEKRDITSRVNWVLNGEQGKHPKLVQNNL